MIRVAMTWFPLAAGLPVPGLPMSPLMRAIVHLRLNGFGYKRIARELGISRERARDYAQAADLGGVRGYMPPRRKRPATVRATSCVNGQLEVRGFGQVKVRTPGAVVSVL